MVFVFVFFLLFHFDILPCKFSARCTLLTWLRYWCAEIMNYETVVQPSAAATPFATLYTCILMRCHPYFSLYTLASYTENYSWRPAFSATVYSLSPPCPYTYDTHIYIFVAVVVARSTTSPHPKWPGYLTPNGNSFRISRRRRIINKFIYIYYNITYT